MPCGVGRDGNAWSTDVNVLGTVPGEPRHSHVLTAIITTVDAMVSCEIIQGPTPQNQERSRRRFGDRRGRGEHGDLRAPPERLSAPGIDDVAQHRRSEPRRLTPRSRRRACLFVERELAGEATFGMAQDDTPSPSGRGARRGGTRLSPGWGGGAAGTAPGG